MESNYIIVTLDGKAEFELECEPDGRYTMSSLAALVGCTPAGLTYSAPHSSRTRGVRIQDGVLLPPSDGWQTSKNRVYRIVLNTMEKTDDRSDEKKGRVWIFLDNSNFWIGAKKQIGEMRGMKCEDCRVRTEFGQLLKFIVSGRPIANAILYGSEPPPSDSVWDMAEQEGWTVNLSHKSVQGKEKQVDAKMVADIVETACTNPPETMVLITGDCDFVCAINKAQEHEWKVEVYGWNKSMSEEIKLMHNNGYVQITSIDVHFNEFMITELQYDLNIVKENGALNLSGIVFEVKESSRLDNIENMKKLCDRLVVILRRPVQYSWLNSHHVAIELRGTESYVNDEVLKSISDEKFDGVKKVMTYIQYLHSTNPSVQALAITNMPSVTVTDFGKEKSQENKEEKFTIVKRKQKPKHQKFSDFCKHKFNCQYGVKCENKHTEEEKAFFKKHGRSIPTRKTKLCTYFPNCKRTIQDCLNAHGEVDAWCNICLVNGHFADEKKCSKS